MDHLTITGGRPTEAELERQLEAARAARLTQEQATAAQQAADAALTAQLHEHKATLYAAFTAVRKDLLAGKQLNKLLLRYYAALAVYEQAVVPIAAAGPAWQALANIRSVQQQHALFPALPLLDMYADPEDRQAIQSYRTPQPLTSFDGTQTIRPRGSA